MEAYVTMTYAGTKLLARAIAQEMRVDFVKAVFGSGTAEKADAVNLTELVSYVADGTMTTPVQDGDTVSISAQYRNDLNPEQEAFFLYEFGLVAQTEDGEQALCVYGCLGDSPDHVSKYNSDHLDVFTYPLQLTIGSVSSVSLTVDAGAFITSKELTDKVKTLDKKIAELAKELLLTTHPVGTVEIRMDELDPADLYGGTWKKLQDTFLLASGSRAVGDTGGEETHALTVEEMPAHDHGGSTSSDGKHCHGSIGESYTNAPWGLYDSSKGHMGSGSTDYDNYWYNTSTEGSHSHTISSEGGGKAHNNMPPYIVVNVWRRTA